MKKNNKPESRQLGNTTDRYFECYSDHLAELSSINFKYIEANGLSNALCINLYSHLLLNIISDHFEGLTESEIDYFKDILISNFEKNVETIKQEILS